VLLATTTSKAGQAKQGSKLTDGRPEHSAIQDVADRPVGFLGSVFCVLCSVGLRGAQRPSALSPSVFCVLCSVFWGFWGFWGVTHSLSRGRGCPFGAEPPREEETLTWPPHAVCAEFDKQARE